MQHPFTNVKTSTPLRGFYNTGIILPASSSITLTYAMPTIASGTCHVLRRPGAFWHPPTAKRQ